MTIKASWQKIETWFAARIQREKIMLTAAVILGVYVLWLLLLSWPISAKLQQLRNEELGVLESNQSLTKQIEEIKLQIAQSPAHQLQQEYQQLQQAMASVNQQLLSSLRSINNEKDVEKSLDLLVTKTTDIHFLGFKTLPPQLLSAVTDTQDAKPNKTMGAIYRLGMVLRFRGSFVATLHFIEQIEQQQLPIIWDSIEYHVDNYPLANVQLTLQVLKDDQELWEHNN